MVSSRHRKKRKKSMERQEAKFITQEAVTFLIEESLRNRIIDPLHSQDLYRSALKIGKRGRFHIPDRYHFMFCHSCNSPLSIKTAKIRLNSKKRQIHYQCLNCNKNQRFGYSKIKKSPKKV